jgi:hypothetical protein
MSRRLKRIAVLTLAAGVAVACLVPNVELVEQLPSEGNKGGTTAGGAGDSEAGAPAPSEGGEPSSAGSSNGGASSGTDAAGSSNGGTSNAGTGNGGTSNAGHGGSSGEWVFSGSGACDGQDPALFCDDFEMPRLSNWGAGPLWERNAIAGAPSPTHVMQTAYKDAAMLVSSMPTSGFNVSFWVRFPSLTDQAFISWPVANGNLSFGLEESSFRFRLDSNPVTVAPELPKYTRGAAVDTWTCVEIDVAQDGIFQATVTVFGEQPLELAALGGTPSPGIDEKLLQAVPGQALTLGSGAWTLGQVGAALDFDDVRVVTIGKQSVCQEFLAANR